MRVCYFGTYDQDYIRNRVIISGLEANGVEIAQCHVKLWEGTADKIREVQRGFFNPSLWRRFLGAYTKLVREYLKARDYDVMVVGYAGHIDVFLARILASLARKPLVFDAFLSFHETIVDDRGLAGRRSIIGSLAFWLEKAACLVSDIVLLDTEAHVQHFSAKYQISRQKFRRIHVGADEELYQPMNIPRKDGLFKVVYFGKFIPLHGVEHIVRAAKALKAHPDILFEFVGEGQTYDKVRGLAEQLQVPNIAWGPEWLEPPELRQWIAKADVCLGIFGTSEKAGLVIPTKAYIALAMNKPLVTRDSPAAREILIDGVNAILCPPGDCKALADAILNLKQEPQLRNRVAQNGHKLFVKHLCRRAIGQEVKLVLKELS